MLSFLFVVLTITTVLLFYVFYQLLLQLLFLNSIKHKEPPLKNNVEDFSNKADEFISALDVFIKDLKK